VLKSKNESPGQSCGYHRIHIGYLGCGSSTKRSERLMIPRS